MLSIAIPSSALINENDDKIKAYKVGQIARAAAIFRADRIIIYRDPLLDESEYIRDLLEYAATPQYLRKQLFPLKPSLRFAGVMPPLKIPSHKPKTLKTGDVREGVIRRVGPDGTCWVDIGLKALALLRLKKSSSSGRSSEGNSRNSQKKLKRGARVTVRVCSKSPLVVELAEPQEYWGYGVEVKELSEVLSSGEVVVTSRRGAYPSAGELKELKNPVFVFGNPKEGVQEIAKRAGVRLETSRVWNFVPSQGTETVRLEEALLATLSIYNFVREVL